MWNPGWAKADHATAPSTTYSYLVSESAANVTTTLKRNGSYATTYTFYDGLLRPRETQAIAEATQDRLVTETLYDTCGFTRKTYAAYYVAGAPSTTLVTATTAVAVLTLAITRRKQLPFGQARGTSGAFPGDQGFVGGTTDPTGLTTSAPANTTPSWAASSPSTPSTKSTTRRR